MILIIDFDNTKHDILLAGDGAVRRFSSPPGKGFRGLDGVLDLLRGEGYGRADGVAVVLPSESERVRKRESEKERRRESERVRRDMSWSTVRSAVALGNALAFAWGVPAVRIDGARRSKMGQDGARRGKTESSSRVFPRLPASCSIEDGLIEQTLGALRNAKPDARVNAAYDGEPNITKPKQGS